MRPVNESIQELGDRWLVGGRLLLSRQATPPAADLASWSDGHGSFFALAESTPLNCPAQDSRPLSKASPLQKVYDAGGVSAVWHVGEAFIKVHKVTMPEATREHVTLSWLHDRMGALDLGFDIPHVLYHAEFDGYYYLVLTRLPGLTLAQAWPNMDEAAREDLVRRVSEICQDLAARWTGDRISGVDGGWLSDLYLTRRGDHNLDPSYLLKVCSEQLGMDCSSFVFYHCDLGATNILVNPESRTIGIIDWETAGFVPRQWIRTKFRVSSGLDLPSDDLDKRVAWRRSVSRRLEEMGFSDVVERLVEWWKSE